MVKSDNRKLDRALVFKNVSYKYPGATNWVLNNINLEIPVASFFVIVGPTGCGKTTLAMVARGLYKEYGGDFLGDIYVFGESVKETGLEDLGSKIGIIFQDPACQLHQLRVIDEVMSGPMYQGLPWQDCKQKAQELIVEILGEEFYERSPDELSNGEQQKVALAACLAMNCKLLILDEPFSFLDIKAAEEILSILLQLKKRGKTIILVIHNLEQIAKYADMIALMDKGRIISSGDPIKTLYSKKLGEIVDLPLSIQVAKSLIKREILKEKIVSWEDLFNKVVFEEKTKSAGIDTIQKKTNREKILEATSLSYTYPNGIVGVKDLSLDVYKGEILGIIGQNGSGKTTLAKLFLGLLKPSKGEIRFRGENIKGLRTSQRATKIGYITQNPADMLFENSVLQEAAFGPKVLGLPSATRKAKKALSAVGILRYCDKHPDSLSGGEKRLLSIADVLANEPEILIFDEPEFGLDLKTWELISSKMKYLTRRGKTIILITHNLEYTVFLCDRIAMMGNKRILEVGQPKEIYSNYELLRRNGLVFLRFFEVLDKVANNAFRDKNKFISELNLLAVKKNENRTIH